MAKPTEPPARPKKHWFHRLQVFSVGFGSLYLGLVVLLSIPFFQAHVLYANTVRLPWFAQFDVPEKYGLSRELVYDHGAAGKTLNLRLNTSDGVDIGAWFVLSDRVYQALPAPPTTSDLDAHITPALKSHPTILFFHGNAATRAFRVRVQHYTDFAARLGVNVLAIDYRGFGDSAGKPSEEGLARDARAAWDWAVGNGAAAEDVLIVGHSLGTAVATKLGVELGAANVPCRGVVLLSPFSSIQSLLDTYSFFGLIPLIKPLAMIPGALKFVARRIVHPFDTLKALPGIKAPLLIAHSEDDWDIPYTHSETLFDSLLNVHLPSLPIIPLTATEWTSEDWAAFSDVQRKRTELRQKLVARTEIRHFGTREEFESGGRKVVLLKTIAGGHDQLGIQGGVQDTIKDVFRL